MDQSQFNGTVTGCLKKIKNKKTVCTFQIN